jgi:hypothetical protein
MIWKLEDFIRALEIPFFFAFIASLCDCCCAVGRQDQRKAVHYANF